MGESKQLLRRAWASYKKRVKKKLPLNGYPQECGVESGFVDRLTDQELDELNNILSWNCFTVDSHGRRFGDVAWDGKRNAPQAVPDSRIALMNEQFGLADKHVLEIGCFEGVHTVGLCRYAKSVSAFDSRIENVVKAIVRAAMFGYSPRIFLYNIERNTVDFDLLAADVMHHVGVLYHLRDPVRHLQGLGKYIRTGVMLDTHYCEPQEAVARYTVNGTEYRYKRYQEFGHGDVFSGMYDHAKWLQLQDIIHLLNSTGFESVDVIEKRQERNGPRVLLIAKRS